MLDGLIVLPQGDVYNALTPGTTDNGYPVAL